MNRREFEEFIKRNPDEAMKLISEAFKPRELLTVGNRSYIDAYRHPESRFDPQDLCSNGHNCPPNPDMLQPLSDPGKLFTDKYVIPPSSLIFQWADRVYDKKWWGEVAGGLTDAVAVTQAALDALTNEGTVFIKAPLTCDGEIVIRQNHISILTGRKADRKYTNDVYGVRIRQIKIDSIDRTIDGIVLSGISMRQLHIHANGRRIRFVTTEKCGISKTGTYHGIIYEGDGTTTAYIDSAHFIDCLLTHEAGYDGDTWGLSTWKNIRFVTQTVYQMCVFEGYASNQTYFLCYGDAQPDWMKVLNSRFYHDTGIVGVSVFRWRTPTQNSYGIGFNALFQGNTLEMHSPCTWFYLETTGAFPYRHRINIQAIANTLAGAIAPTIVNSVTYDLGANIGILIFTHNRGITITSLGTLPAVPFSLKLIARHNTCFLTDTLLSTGLTPVIGLNGVYGAATSVVSLSGIIELFKLAITIGGVFAGETITVKVETQWYDLSTLSIEKNYVAVSAKTWLTDDEVQSLWKNANRLSSIRLYAKASSASTNVTVSIDIMAPS